MKEMTEIGVPAFLRLLRRAYRTDPCAVLPNSFWKTEVALRDSRCFATAEGDSPRSLVAYTQTGLEVCWSRDQPVSLPESLLLDLEVLLLHNTQITATVASRFGHRDDYFRASARVARTMPSPDYIDFPNADPPCEADDISGFIRDCYSNASRPTTEEVQSWAGRDVYAPETWVWAIDRRSGARLGLCIGEVDFRIPEASLEWVQVAPAHRGGGVGKALVHEVMARIGGAVGLVTVSGRADPDGRTLRFYRRCGFTGEDLWHVFRK